MFIGLDKNGEVPIKKQLYDTITFKILNGELAKGDKLPSTRELADKLGIARNTVIEIYEQLVSEAYLEAFCGKGTFVSGGREGIAVNDILPAPGVKGSFGCLNDNDRIDFASGVPDLKSFPRKAWLRALKESLEEAEAIEFGYGSVLGYQPLRESLSRYLLRYKGIRCTPGQIVIVNGTSDALNLCALLFQKSERELMVESAVVSFVPDIFRIFGYNIKPLETDQYGLCTKDLSETGGGLIFCSPSHQFPLGGTLSIERRLQLADYARAHSHYIIEDDYNSEFMYTGAQVNSLFQLAPENVIHMGTFSKALAPFLRLGYMVVPAEMVPGVKELQSHLCRRVNMHDQMALNYLFQQGIYVKHVAAMCKRYKRKMRCIVDALKSEFGEGIDIYGTSSGLHIAVAFSEPLFDAGSTSVFLGHKVMVDQLTDYMIEKQNKCDTLILGFGNLDESMIAEGIKRLKAAVSEMGARHDT